MMIAIVDYNMGNLASVQNAFAKLGKNTTVVDNPLDFSKYDKLVLPGVGAFGDAMDHLRERNMVNAIKEFAKSGKPMIGICLGMQLLFESSEEFGQHEGLGLIKGHVKAFDELKFSESLKVPHMGWNRVFTKDHLLFHGVDKNHYLYFVHTFHVTCKDANDIIGETEYGYKFTSAVAHDNIMGIQPHPEKSHENGLKIIENFIKL